MKNRREKSRAVIAVAMDVDGVWTDGTFWWSERSKNELKRFSFLDVMGVSLGRKAGLVFALVSGEDSKLVDRLALKLGITDVHKNCKDKARALRRFADKHKLELSQTCFMGDDVNDLPAMELAGLAAAPANAHAAVKRRAGLVTRQCGGQGAVRELIDYLLAQRTVRPQQHNTPSDNPQ